MPHYDPPITPTYEAQKKCKSVQESLRGDQNRAPGPFTVLFRDIKDSSRVISDIVKLILNKLSFCKRRVIMKYYGI